MLSVIIPTRSRATQLHKALESLISQTLQQNNFEIIVVDNGSTDRTREVVSSFYSRLCNLRYFYEHRPGLHVGRHKGCIEANSNLLVFADDDIEAFPTWLQAIWDSFCDEQVVLVGGKCLPKFEADPPDWLNCLWLPNASGVRSLGHLSLIDLGDDIKTISPCQVYGCNFAIRRTVLLEVGGFHPDSMPPELISFRGDGETHVSKCLDTKGYKAFYNPMASVYHWVPVSRMSKEYFCLRSYNQGVSDSYTAIRAAGGIISEVSEKRHILQRLFYSFFKKLNVSSGLIKSIYAFAIDNTVSSIEVASLRFLFSEAYQEGYLFHQRQVRQTPQLLEWVLRPDYWDGRIPIITSEV